MALWPRRAPGDRPGRASRTALRPKNAAASWRSSIRIPQARSDARRFGRFLPADCLPRSNMDAQNSRERRTDGGPGGQFVRSAIAPQLGMRRLHRLARLQRFDGGTNGLQLCRAESPARYSEPAALQYEPVLAELGVLSKSALSRCRGAG